MQRFVAIWVLVILAAALPPGTESAQPQSGEAQAYQLYPRADLYAPLQRGLAKPVELNFGQRLERIRCAGSAMCAWRRVPAPGEHIWWEYNRTRRR